MENIPHPVHYKKYAPPMRSGFSIEPLENSFYDVQLGNGIDIFKSNTYLASIEVWDWNKNAILSCIITDKARKFPITLTRYLRTILDNLHSIGYKRVITAGEAHSPEWLYKSGFVKDDRLQKFFNGMEVYSKWDL